MRTNTAAVVIGGAALAYWLFMRNQPPGGAAPARWH